MHTRLLFVASLLLAACSSGGTTADAGTDSGSGTDLLVGSWFEQVTPVTSDDQTATFTFQADGTYTLAHTQLDGAATATPGCTETQSDHGTYTESDAMGPMRLTLTPSAGSGSVVLSGCDNATDNGPGPTGTPFAVPSTPYTVTATTLTLNDASGMPASTFMRR